MRPWPLPRPTMTNLLRAGLVAILLSALAFLGDFAAHFQGHFSGDIVHRMITGEWYVVALNALAFIGFLVPLSYRRRVDWRERGLVVAFFVSLFVEMYGAPLLLTLVAPALEPLAPASMATPITLDLLGVRFAFTVPMLYGTLLIVLGTALVVVGWATLYRGLRTAPLVTTGVYSATRNPQYLGFILVLAGWFVGWPTVLVVVMAPVLIFMYARLCRSEERELEGLERFEAYRARVPRLL